VEIYPGTYEEYLWSKAQRDSGPPAGAQITAKSASNKTPAVPSKQADSKAGRKQAPPAQPVTTAPPAQPTYEDKKRADAETRRRRRADDERRSRITELEQRIAAHEAEIKAIEDQMTAATFYDDRAIADAAIARHQKLMWEVGDLMNRWETLQNS
jgi:hypothetical protein